MIMFQQQTQKTTDQPEINKQYSEKVPFLDMKLRRVRKQIAN